MPDYNIYIHAIGTAGSTGENPTVPWSARESGGGAFSPTSSQSGSSGGGGLGGVGSTFARAITKTAGYMQNPDSLVSTGVSMLARVFPWVAVAMAVIKTSESIVNNIVDFSTIETGDYANQVRLNDVKAMMHLVTHPVSTLVQGFKMERQWARENQKLKAQRDLLGDSIINSYTGRGV